MREMEFKMEIEYEHIKPGAEVKVEQSELQGGLVVYYTIIPAIAMSGNFRKQEALKDFHGTVKNVRVGDGGGWYVTVEFAE
ncbi:hypothetical protein SAMN06296386_108104 [Lachnospiraceae bacterium]|nr:hypothetical protein SAMN06296386_108104 [Lachnospiraceae bacterium]